MGLWDPKGRITITTDEETKEGFEALCEKRGLTVDQMFRVMVAGYHRRKIYFELDDVINFGKYAGLRCEEVVRADPRYMNWLLRESSWFRLSPIAGGLLEEMGEED